MNEICYWHFCFIPLSTSPVTKIFGFSEFLAAIALLAVVYTITDVRYKFRIAVTPGFLYVATFGLIAIIGLQTLLTEIWIAENWWVPKTMWITRATWQGIFGLLFLGTFLTWMYYAFISPPIFGRRNARRFAQELYRYILRGNDDELKVIANELARSAKALIRHSRCLPPRNGSNKEVKMKGGVEDYAHDILLLIANRKFCRQIVSASPVTAQAFFEEMACVNKFDIPIGQFARNISSEAVAQKGSFLYEEGERYTSGLMGYLKPVSRAVYGNFQLVEGLASSTVASPLDIYFEEQWTWDAKQWRAYCRAILITLRDCLEKECGSQNSYALNRAFGDIESAYRDLYKLNEMPETYNTDIYERLQVVVEFVKNAIELLDKQKNPPKPLNRVREGTYPKNIYDHLAILIFDICFAASSVKSPPDTCWSIHYSIVWSTFFSGINEGVAWKVVRFKVRRLLYDEIAELSNWPNYKGSGVLGYCLNVLGVSPWTKKRDVNRDGYALAKAVQAWTKKHYLSMQQKNSDVAESVLIGSLSFDKAGSRLIKTYRKGLNQEVPKTYLELEPASPELPEILDKTNQ
ncbi:MAG: hypothetical protein WA056_09825 [Gallionella sp.]